MSLVKISKDRIKLAIEKRNQLKTEYKKMIANSKVYNRSALEELHLLQKNPIFNIVLAPVPKNLLNIVAICEDVDEVFLDNDDLNWYASIQTHSI